MRRFTVETMVKNHGESNHATQNMDPVDSWCSLNVSTPLDAWMIFERLYVACRHCSLSHTLITPPEV